MPPDTDFTAASVRWPLARTSRFWQERGFWVQFVLQAVAAVFFLGIDATQADLEGAVPWQNVCRLVGYAACFVALLIQRYHAAPGLILAAAGLGLAALAQSGVYGLAYCVVVVEAWYISAFIRHRRWIWLVCLVSGSVAGIASFSWTAYPVGGTWAERLAITGALSAFALLSIAFAWQVGLGTSRRNADFADLAARAELATLAERNRIAREMHDIVAHSLTAVIAQADGGRYAGKKEPGRALDALETISSTGRDALAQMRRLLAVLGDDAERSRDAVPGLDGIPGLVAAAERDGLSVDVRNSGEPRMLTDAQGLAVYRTVQEGLTNVLKHAGPTLATITLDWQPKILVVQVDNAPGKGLFTTEAGRGLIGLAERASIIGGVVRWGDSDAHPGGFFVRMEVPT